MKAVISFTNDDQYVFFAPIISWGWQMLGIGTHFIIPESLSELPKWKLVLDNCTPWVSKFTCPEHKEATYAQVSRLYAASLYEGVKDECLVTSDADMLVFKNEFVLRSGLFNLGHDLVPKEQLPMCYTWGLASDWRRVFGIGSKTLQQCLDEQLAHEECENMRGNLWCRDQEILANKFNEMPSASVRKFNRARPGTQFATNRVDRDDVSWRSYLGPNLLDAHLWRPGYTDENFPKILELLQTQYPEENFDWVIKYKNDYLKLV